MTKLVHTAEAKIILAGINTHRQSSDMSACAGLIVVAGGLDIDRAYVFDPIHTCNLIQTTAGERDSSGKKG